MHADTINFYISICSRLVISWLETPEEKEKYVEYIKGVTWLYLTSTDSERNAIMNENKKINDAIAVKKFRDLKGLDVPDNEMRIIDPDKYEEQR